MQIDYYRFGKIIVDGETYTKDIIILPDKIIANWWRNSGHIFTPEDCIELLESDAEVIVFGLGAYSRAKLSSSLIKTLKSRRIEYKSFSTSKAVKSFNELAEKGIMAAAALHLTC